MAEALGRAIRFAYDDHIPFWELKPLTDRNICGPTSRGHRRIEPKGFKER